MIPGALDRKLETVTLGLRHVLVVDEALPVRRKMLDILHRSGVPAELVRQAETAEAALEAFAKDHPDLVFAELVGAGEEGLGMLREMLAIDPKARLILVTAEAPGSPLVRQAIRMGVFAIVEKPLRHDKIRTILSEIEDEETGIQRFR